MAAPANTLLTALQNLHIQRSSAAQTQNDKEDTQYLHFYRLTKGGKIFYLFGTNHSISLEALSDPANTYIKSILQSNELILTEGLFKRLTADSLKKLAYFKLPYQLSPWKSFTQKEKNVLEPIIQKIMARHNIDFAIEDLKVAALHDFIMRNIWENGADTEIHIQHANKIDSLDDKSECEALNELSLNECHFTTSIREFKQIIDDFFFNLEHQKLWNESIVEYLSGKPTFPEDKDEIAEMKATNVKWLKKLFKSLEQKNNISAVLGARHLYGDFGFLEACKAAGYFISRMTTEGIFSHYMNNAQNNQIDLAALPKP